MATGYGQNRESAEDCDDTSSVLEFLSIYMSRITMCEKAAAFLGQRFELCINGRTVNNR